MDAEPARWVEGGDPWGAHRACVRGGPRVRGGPARWGRGTRGRGDSTTDRADRVDTPSPRGPARARGCYQELNPPAPLSPVQGYRRAGRVTGAAVGNVLGTTVPLDSDPSGAPLTYLQLAPGWQPCILVSAFDNGASFPEWGWGLPGGPQTGLASPTPPLWSLRLSSPEQLDRAACVPSGTWPKGAARLHRGRGSLPLCPPRSIPPCGLPSA